MRQVGFRLRIDPCALTDCVAIHADPGVAFEVMPVVMLAVATVNETDAGVPVTRARVPANAYAGHAFAPKFITDCPRRFAAISQYFSSSSIPMARRPRFLAASKVVPEPMNGSRISSPGSVN